MSEILLDTTFPLPTLGIDVEEIKPSASGGYFLSSSMNAKVDAVAVREFR